MYIRPASEQVRIGNNIDEMLSISHYQIAHKYSSGFCSFQSNEDENTLKSANTLILLVNCLLWGLFFLDVPRDIKGAVMHLYPNYFVKLMTYITGNHTKVIAKMKATDLFTYNDGIFTPKSKTTMTNVICGTYMGKILFIMLYCTVSDLSRTVVIVFSLIGRVVSIWN